MKASRVSIEARAEARDGVVVHGHHAIVVVDGVPRSSRELRSSPLGSAVPEKGEISGWELAAVLVNLKEINGAARLIQIFLICIFHI